MARSDIINENTPYVVFWIAVAIVAVVAASFYYGRAVLDTTVKMGELGYIQKVEAGSLIWAKQ